MRVWFSPKYCFATAGSHDVKIEFCALKTFLARREADLLASTRIQFVILFAFWPAERRIYWHALVFNL